MTILRSAGHVTSIIGGVTALLYLWLRYFSPNSPVSIWVGILSFLCLSAGLYLLLSGEVPRRWRTPHRLLRWNALLGILGAAHAVLWGSITLLMSTSSIRTQGLVTALFEVGVVVQAGIHLALVGHLVSFRVRPVKSLAISGYFVLVAIILIIQNISSTIGTLLAPLLWVGLLPILYLSDWLQEVISQKLSETLALLTITVVILGIAWGVVPSHFLETLPPLFKSLSFVLMAVVLLHSGWIVVLLLLRLVSFGKGEGQSLELLTEFLARQQSSTSPQMIIDITKETLKKLPPVAGSLILLRATPEETLSTSNISNAAIRETLRRLLSERSGTEAYIEFIASLQKHHKMLPDISAILAQRPLFRLSGALLNQTLSVAVVSISPDGFEEKDIELIKTLTEQTAIFLENLDRRSYQEQLLTARKEIDFLRETREALMPPPPPILKKVDFHVHFEQYDRTIGGDYYQIHESPDGSVVDFWLSDSAGSGIAAAYQMAQARAALNTLWLQELEAEEMLFRLNDALKRVFHKNNFLAATLLRFDFRRKEYILFRAGNPEIFYWNPLVDEVDVLRPSGIVLGSTSSQIIKKILTPEKGRLMPGSLFLFFSDGFSEAANLSGEMFGVERLLSVFKAHVHATPSEIAEAIVQEVRTFVGDTSLGDDGTLLVVRYLG
ncbi:MAG: serine/threonine-protein phosphatase [Bacteroidia bacterium]|nr:serine/threonine-protein phosphatase [Bacteroidia bacterium]